MIIGGGGVMGCSSAYFLSQRISPNKICIIERDHSYTKSSTVLSVGSIRQQFSLEENILLSLHSSRFIKNVKDYLSIEGEEPVDIQFVEGGYLFLATEKGEEVLRRKHSLQKRVGAKVELLTPLQLKKQFPWMNTDGLVLGSLGISNEGWFDPYLLLNAFKRKILSLGVHMIYGEVKGLNIEDEQVNSVQVVNSSETFTLSCDHYINAAGPHAADVALMAGIGSKEHPDPRMHVELPVRPKKRYVFVLHCPGGPSENVPMIIDPSGFYIRSETQRDTYICGMSPPEELDPDSDDLEVDYSFFDERIWPLLANRIPAFEALKVRTSWAGFYDYNIFDQNGIIGAHPVIKNFVFVNGFSGHGIQQSPEVGRAVSEVVLDGSPVTLKLKEFGFERIIENKKLLELNIV